MKKPIFISGPKGSGKTTLAQFIAGNLRTKVITETEYVNTNWMDLFDEISQYDVLVVEEMTNRYIADTIIELIQPYVSQLIFTSNRSLNPNCDCLIYEL